MPPVTGVLASQLSLRRVLWALIVVLDTVVGVNLTFVASPVELEQAAARGAEHVVLTAHLDLRHSTPKANVGFNLKPAAIFTDATATIMVHSHTLS